MLNLLYNLATDKYNGFFASLAKCFLFLLSLIYGVVIRGLSSYYRIHPYRPGCKVISIGNITLGGTGKTPLVAYIANFLKNRHRLAVVSRGYGKRKDRCQSIGDEPQMLKDCLEGVEVIVNQDRVAAINKSIETGRIDTVLLDDGFQQWRIRKDLEIVSIDATNPFGNKHMIPRGILREPLSSLARADIFVITKTNINSDTAEIYSLLKDINPSALIVESAYRVANFYPIQKPGEYIKTELIKSKSVALVSGIADPSSFATMVAQEGIGVAGVFAFPDHYHYTKEDINRIVRWNKEKNVNALIITEKDAAKLSQLNITEGGLEVLVMRIEVVITKNEKELHNRLNAIYSS